MGPPILLSVTVSFRPPFDHETGTVPAGHGPSSAATLQLVVVGSDGVSAHDLPSRGRVSLGRSIQNAIAIADASVSRAHAVLEIGPPLRITHVGSANGLRVRGNAVPAGESMEIAQGEPIELGSVTVVVRAGAAPAVTVAPMISAPVGSHPARPTLPPPPRRTPVRPPGVIVRSPSMQQLFDLVAQVADSTLSVLLLGETGAGKEVVADAIHCASPRAARPFVGLNCAALSETLLESELFGHEKGAFTGAVGTKPGLMETAEGGTVFLDEVGELPLATQVKLLRVLELRQVLRVGGLRPLPIDVRIIAATHRDLRAAIDRGTFRQDLFFRLNGITLEIPPLRERTEEIPDLVMLFASRATGGRATDIAPEALAALCRYAWPGNIRELRNCVERAVLLSHGGTIGTEHLPREVLSVSGASLPPSVRAPDEAPVPATPARTPTEGGRSLRDDLAAMERERILNALAQCAGNQTRAAEILGIPRRTLTERLRTYEIPRPRKR